MNMRMKPALQFLLGVGFLVVLLPSILTGRPPQSDAGLEGDAARGRGLFTTTYKCYACHGYQGETGTPRLNPMQMPRDGFLAFVQSGAANGAMPAYGDAPTQDLVDVYQYIRSLPLDAESADSIPLLEAILAQVGNEN